MNDTNLFSRMPYAMCTNTASTQLDDTIFFDDSESDESEIGDSSFAIPNLKNDECWNGAENGNYPNPIVADGLSNQANNPEVPVKPIEESSGLPNIVKEQVRDRIK